MAPSRNGEQDVLVPFALYATQTKRDQGPGVRKSGALSLSREVHQSVRIHVAVRDCSLNCLRDCVHLLQA